jgi:hypothetical protein
MHIVRTEQLGHIETEDDLAGVAAAVDGISEKKKVRLRGISAPLEYADQDIDVPVDVAEDGMILGKNNGRRLRSVALRTDVISDRRDDVVQCICGGGPEGMRL